MLLLGCAGMANLKTRAAFDMQCPKKELRFHELGTATYGVRGCGQRSTYVCKQQVAARACQDWVLNSDIKDTARVR